MYASFRRWSPVLCALLGSGPLAAQTVRLSERLTRLGPPRVQQFEVRDSGVTFTVEAAMTTAHAPTLFSISADGSGTPLALAEPFDPIEGTSFTHQNFWYSPDGTQLVVFGTRDFLDPDAFQGFQVLSTVTHELRRLVSAEPVTDVAFTPDSVRLLSFGQNYLFSVPVDGSAPAVALDSFQERAGTLQLAPDSSSGVIQMRDSGSPWELRSLPLDGSGAPRVLATGSMAWVSEISGDSLRVAYLAGDGNLYSALVDGGAPPVLLSSTHPGAALGALPALAAGDRIVYQADLGGALGLALFSVPIDGSAPPLQLASRLQGFEELVLDPDGTLVVFRSDAVLPGTMELVVAAVDGSTPVQRLAPARGRARVVPGAATVVYDEGNYQASFGSLLAVPLDGSAPPVRLVPLAGHALELSGLAFDSSGTRVAYFGDEQVDGQYELSIVALDGSQAPLLLSGGLMSGGLGALEKLALEFGPGDEALVFQAPSGLTGHRVFSVPVDGSRLPLELTRFCAAAFEGEVTRFEVHGPWAVYTGDLRAAGREELFSTLLTRRFRLSDPADGSQVPEFRISGDGDRVVFRQGQSSSRRLYSIPIDGSAARIPLSPDGLDVQYILALPGGDRVVFEGKQGSGAPYELWLTSVDGSTAPVALPVQGVPLMQVSPDGRWLAYRVGLDLMRIDATSALPPLVLASSVASTFSFTPDSDRLVFSSFDGTALFSRRSDGTGTNQRLNGASQSLSTFLPTSDSSRVVFQYRSASQGKVAVVPIDGSSSEVLLHSGPSFGLQLRSLTANEVLVTEGSHLLVVSLVGAPTFELPVSLYEVNAFFHHPSSAHAFVLGRAFSSQPQALYRIRMDGSEQAELVQAFAGHSNLYKSAFSPDGARFGWTVDLERDFEHDLFLLASDGPLTPLRVNRKLSYGSRVQDWSFALGGNAVVYTASERGVYELFARLWSDEKWVRAEPTPSRSVTLQH